MPCATVVARLANTPARARPPDWIVPRHGGRRGRRLRRPALRRPAAGAGRRAGVDDQGRIVAGAAAAARGCSTGGGGTGTGCGT